MSEHFGLSFSSHPLASHIDRAGALLRLVWPQLLEARLYQASHGIEVCLLRPGAPSWPGILPAWPASSERPGSLLLEALPYTKDDDRCARLLQRPGLIVENVGFAVLGAWFEEGQDTKLRILNSHSYYVEKHAPGILAQDLETTISPLPEEAAWWTIPPLGTLGTPV